MQAEMVQLTKNLHVPAIQAHGSGAQVWHSAAVRKGRLKAVIISTAVFIVLAAASIFLLALVTLPAVLAPFARDRVVKPLPQEPNDGTLSAFFMGQEPVRSRTSGVSVPWNRGSPDGTLPHDQEPRNAA